MGNLIDTDGLDQYTDEITTFTSGDSSSPSSFTTIPVVASKEKPSSLFQKLSQAIANIRWLYNNKRGSGAFNAQNDTVTFTTADVSSDSSATSWTSVSQLTSGSTFSTLMNRISAMMKNTRYLKNKLTEVIDISAGTGSTSFPCFSQPRGNHVRVIEVHGQKIGNVCCYLLGLEPTSNFTLPANGMVGFYSDSSLIQLKNGYGTITYAEFPGYVYPNYYPVTLRISDWFLFGIYNNSGNNISFTNGNGALWFQLTYLTNS